MFDADFLDRIVNGFGRRLEIAKACLQAHQRATDPSEFLLRRRGNERLEPPEPFAGLFIKVLLAQDETCIIFDHWIRMVGIRMFFREAACRLPKGRPQLRTRPVQHARRKRCDQESFGFLALPADFGSRIKHGGDGFR